MIVPTIPPIVATVANRTSTSGGKPTAAREARIPELTPRTPSAFPWLARTGWIKVPDDNSVQIKKTLVRGANDGPMQRVLLVRYPACARPMLVWAAARNLQVNTTAGMV